MLHTGVSGSIAPPSTHDSGTPTLPEPSRFPCQLMSVSVLAPSPRQEFGQLLHLAGGGHF